MPEAQTKEKEVKESKKAAEETVTLPKLMGNIVTNIMSALEQDNIGLKQLAIQQSQRDFRLWYESQPVEDRKEFAKKTRKSMENFKLIGEQFYQELMAISSQDV